MTTRKKRQAKKKPWQTFTEWNDLGERLHTGLRKLCDSTVTTAAWNLIYLCDDGWAFYLQRLCPLLAGCTTVDEVRWAALKAADWRDAEIPRGQRHQVVGLCAVLDCFSEGDWDGFLGFVIA